MSKDRFQNIREIINNSVENTQIIMPLLLKIKICKHIRILHTKD